MIANEYLYELNFPAWDEFKHPNFKGFDIDQVDYAAMQISPLNNVIKDEYLNFLGFTWTQLLCFKRNNKKGSIHIDGPSFGINWILGGKSIVEFFEKDQVVENGYTPTFDNRTDWGSVQKYIQKSNTRPKIYFQQDNKVYLFKTNSMHRVTGIGNRICYSMRTFDTNLEWQDVVETFSQFIIK